MTWTRRVSRYSVFLGTIGACLVLIFATSGITIITQSIPVSADSSASGFNAGLIISDSNFYNANTMSVSDIQNFLNEQVPTCDTNHTGFTGATGTVYGPQWICLKDYYENPNSTYTVNYTYQDTNGNTQTGTRTYYYNNDYTYTSLTPVYNNGTYADGYTLKATITPNNGAIPSGAISAAQIIYDAAQQYGVNPQVLLVILQKEQGLITDTWPAPYEYQSAMGYGCADYQPCYAGYSGFSKQVYSAAYQFTAYRSNPTNYSFVAGQNNYIPYSPIGVSCSGSTVYIQNQATAGLYDYTPYQPDPAALSAGLGTGDSCSSYGNRNFYIYYDEWFGPPAIPVSDVVIPSGIYSLQNVNSSTYLDVANANPNPGAKLQIYHADGTNAQNWLITQDSNGYYSFQNVANGNYLDITGGNMTAGTPLQAYTGNGTCSQKWAAVYENGSYTFLNACSDLAIDVTGGSTADGTSVQIYNSNQTASQSWNLVSRGGAPIVNGVYSLTTSSGLALDIDNAQTTSGTATQIYTANGSAAQDWEFVRQPDGTYTIRNPLSGNYLDTANESSVSGSAVQIWNKDGSCAQKWIVTKNANSTITIQSSCSNVALDVAGGAVSTSGTPVQIYTANGTGSQQWTLSPIQGIPTGTYSLQSTGGLSLDITGGNLSAGTKTQIYTTNGTLSQQWLIAQQGDGTYTLQNPSSGDYLDLTGGSSTPGNQTQIWYGNSTCSQRWNITQNSNSTYTITSSCAGLALDVRGGALYTPGTPAQVYTANATGSQQWLVGNP